MEEESEQLFDLPAFVRVLRTGTGDGRYSAANATQGGANGVPRAIEALRAFIGRLEAPGGAEVLQAYLAAHPRADHLFSPLWLAVQHPSATSAALDALLAATRLDRALLAAVARHHAHAVAHVLAHDRTFLARRALMLLHGAASTPAVAAAVVRRYDLSDVGRPLTAPKSPCRTLFVRLLAALLQHADRDTLRALLTTRAPALLAALRASGEVAQDFHRHSHRSEPKANDATKSKSDDAKRQKKADDLKNHLTAEAIYASLDLFRAVQERIAAAPDFIARLAGDTGLLARVVIVAAARTPQRYVTKTVRAFLDLRETAALITLALARRHGVRPHVVARALGHAHVEQSGEALAFVLRVLSDAPHLARAALQEGPFLAFQPALSSAWLANAAVVIAATRRLTRPVDTHTATAFFERTLAHKSDAVRFIGTTVLAALCASMSDAAQVACLPPFALVRKGVLLGGQWHIGAHSILASYRKWAPLQVTQAGVDAVKLSLEAAGERVQHACPVVLASIEADAPNALAAVFAKDGLEKLLAAGEHGAAKEVLRATGIFSVEGGADVDVDVWLALLDGFPQHRIELQHLVAKAWKQPFALYDDTADCAFKGKRAPLIVAAALRRLAKKCDASAGSFDCYLARTITALAAMDCVFGDSLIRYIVGAKLEKAQQLGVLLFNGEHRVTNVCQAVSCLESVPLITPALAEMRAVARCVGALYEGARPAHAVADCCPHLCQGAGITRVDDRFFQHHADFLAQGIGEEKRAIRVALRMLVVRAARQLVPLGLDGAVSGEDRAVFIRYFLDATDATVRGRALAYALKAVNDFRGMDAELLPVFAEHMLRAALTQVLPQQDLVAFVNSAVANAERIEVLQGGGKMRTWAQLVFRVLGILLARNDGHAIVDVLRDLGASERRALARVGMLAGVFYTHVLQKIPELIPDAVAAVKLAVSLQDDSQPAEAILQLVTFLARDKAALDAPFLVDVALARVWNFADDTDVDKVKQVAFELGSRIGAILAPEEAVDAVTEHLLVEEVIFRVVWWATACGIMSAYRGRKLSEDAARDKARLLVERVASNISPEKPPVAYHGPLELVVHVLHLAQVPVGHLPLASAEREFCTNLCDFATGMFKESANALLGEAAAPRDESLRELVVLLQCVAVAVRVREVSLNLARLALHHFGQQTKALLAIGLQRKTTACEDALRALVDVVESCVDALGAVGMDARSATAMTNMEGLFSSSDFPYFASTSLLDAKVTRVMAIIKRCMSKNEFRKERELPDPRAGLFAPLASNIAPTLSAVRLNATAEHMMRQHQSPSAPSRDVFPRTDVDELPYDPVFALKTLRLACEYAKYTMEATVLDMNAVANGGLLRVALVGIASNDEAIRVQAYAALDALSRAIGPEVAKEQQSAAALYVYRKPLAFVLQVLKDSIDEPLMQVLPLFSSWLWHVLRVMLRPSHKAYVPVLRYLLRSPMVDAEDCTGVVHLLRSTEVGCEVKALRLLALDVLEDGVWSRMDHLVARKRRLYECVLSLAGSSLGVDTQLRDRAVKLLAALPCRLSGGQIAVELCRAHAFGTCFMPQVGDHDENKLPQLMTRVAAIHAVARALPDEFDQSHHAMCMGGSLKMILRVVRGARAKQVDVDDAVKMASCVCTLHTLCKEVGGEFIDDLRWMSEVVEDNNVASKEDKERFGKVVDSSKLLESAELCTTN